MFPPISLCTQSDAEASPRLPHSVVSDIALLRRVLYVLRPWYYICTMNLHLRDAIMFTPPSCFNSRICWDKHPLHAVNLCKGRSRVALNVTWRIAS